MILKTRSRSAEQLPDTSVDKLRRCHAAAGDSCPLHGLFLPLRRIHVGINPVHEGKERVQETNPLLFGHRREELHEAGIQDFHHLPDDFLVLRQAFGPAVLLDVIEIHALDPEKRLTPFRRMSQRRCEFILRHLLVPVKNFKETAAPRLILLAENFKENLLLGNEVIVD
jgi:hypothetical protein